MLQNIHGVQNTWKLLRSLLRAQAPFTTLKIVSDLDKP